MATITSTRLGTVNTLRCLQIASQAGSPAYTGALFGGHSPLNVVLHCGTPELGMSLPPLDMPSSGPRYG